MIMQRRTPFNESRQMQETMDRMWRRFGTASADHHNGIEAWAAPRERVERGDTAGFGRPRQPGKAGPLQQPVERVRTNQSGRPVGL